MNSEDRNPQLENLFEKYREACGSPEPSPNFMPMLWTKIEAKQNKGLLIERIARTFVATAMAACGMLGILILLPNQQPSAFLNSSYVEAIATATAREAAPYLEPVRLDFSADSQSAPPEFR